MFAIPHSIILSDCQTGAEVDGEIVLLDPALAKKSIDFAWWSDSSLANANLAGEEDRHWNWAAVVQKWRYKTYAECLALRTPDKAVQAAVIGLANGSSLLEKGQGCVIVERLATAPWNRESLVDEPRFRGSGTGLLLHLVCLSYQLGLGGRLSLFSFPTRDAIKFYENRGFVKTGETQDDMIHYELAEGKALRWLEQKGLR